MFFVFSRLQLDQIWLSKVSESPSPSPTLDPTQQHYIIGFPGLLGSIDASLHPESGQKQLVSFKLPSSTIKFSQVLSSVEFPVFQYRVLGFQSNTPLHSTPSFYTMRFPAFPKMGASDAIATRLAPGRCPPHWQNKWWRQWNGLKQGGGKRTNPHGFIYKHPWKKKHTF